MGSSLGRSLYMILLLELVKSRIIFAMDSILYSEGLPKLTGVLIFSFEKNNFKIPSIKSLT